MQRIAVLFVVITISELVAFVAYRNHPLIQPHWFGWLLDGIKVAMCWGGIEAARWLLRKSPIARKGVGNDWSRLWLWVGPASGALLCLACLLGWAVSGMNVGRLAGPLVVAHAVAGALCWLIAAPWVAGDLFRQTSGGSPERKILYAGILTHLIGMSLYGLVYPGKTLSPLMLITSLMFYYFILYHLMLSVLMMAGVLSFWKPELVEEQLADLEPGDFDVEDED